MGVLLQIVLRNQYAPPDYSSLAVSRRARGRGYPYYLVEEVEDALLGLARELLPESAAAQWDAEWAHDLCKDAHSRLAKHYAVLSTEERDAMDLCSRRLGRADRGHRSG